jgi:serine/threonine-protein kinase HipA
MQRAERRAAQREGRAPQTLHEADFLLGVSDVSRLGALRFKRPGDDAFQKPAGEGVPGFIQLGRLLASAQRIERDEETDEDLSLIFAPGSSLGGARPKASVMDTPGALAIAKFPKDTDDYSIETWEHIALVLAERAGIRVPHHELHRVGNKPVLLSWRFDRDGELRIPFLSAMSMLQVKDGDRASYPEIVDELSRYGANARADAAELFRRMVFNILISNVDDHLRNHGLLWAGRAGWRLSPAYDLNPTPTDLKARILTTNISLDEGTCSIDLALSQVELFGLSLADAKAIVGEVGSVTKGWREVAGQVGETTNRIDRMASAFEHEDLIVATS